MATKTDKVYKSRVMYVLQSIQKLADGKTKVSLYGPSKEMKLSNSLTHIISTLCCEKVAPKTYLWVARDPDNEMVDDVIYAIREYNLEIKKKAHEKNMKLLKEVDKPNLEVEDDVEEAEQVETVYKSEQLSLDIEQKRSPEPLKVSKEVCEKAMHSVTKKDLDEAVDLIKKNEDEVATHQTNPSLKEDPLPMYSEVSILWGLIKIKRYGKEK